MTNTVQTKYGAVLLGAASLGAQTLLIRSALTVFYGNELLIGGILALWLFWVGLGSGPLFLYLRRKIPHDSIFPLLLTALFLSLVGIVLFRLARIILLVPPGEFIPFFKTMIFAAAVTAPPCLLFGVSFALLAAADTAGSGEPEARIYAWETAAAAVCGLLFSAATPFASNLLLGTLMLSAALWGTAWLLRSRTLGLAGIIAAVIILTGGVEKLDRVVDKLYWRSFARDMIFVAGRPTNFGKTSVVNYAGENWIYKNGGKVAPVINDPAMQPLAAAVVCAHPQPRRILVIEGFLTGLPSALLAFDSLSVTALEFDRLSVEWIDRRLDYPFRRTLEHPRLKLVYKDAVRYLIKTNEQFDVIILNPGAPTTAAAGRFFSAKFLRQLKEHLTTNGVLAIPQIPAGENYLGEEAALFHRTLFKRLQPIFAHVVLLPGDEAAYLAGQNADFTFSVDSLARRYEKLGPHHDFFHPAMFSVLYDSLRSVSLLHQVRELAEQGKNIDLAAEYLADFLLWHKMTSGRSHVGVLLKLSFQRFIVFFLIVLATIFALGYWNRKSRCGSGFIIIAGMVGFAVMALNLALLLAFQVAFGYIYAWLAVLSAAFMIGMASSAAFVNQRSEQFAVGTALEQVLIFMILLAFILLPVLEWIGGRLSLYGTLLLFLLSGAAGGAAFAILCARFRLVTGVVDFGGLYAADVIGGGLSALSLSGLAIPLFGLQRSLYCAVLVLLTALALSVSLRR